MFLTALGVLPHTTAITGLDCNGDPGDDIPGDDTCDTRPWFAPEKRDPPAKAPVYDRAEVDEDDEPLFVHAVDITSPDDRLPPLRRDRPMAGDGAIRTLGIGGGMLAPKTTPAIIGLIRQRDPRTATPIYC